MIEITNIPLRHCNECSYFAQVTVYDGDIHLFNLCFEHALIFKDRMIEAGEKVKWI